MIDAFAGLESDAERAELDRLTTLAYDHESRPDGLTPDECRRLEALRERWPLERWRRP